MSGPPAVLLAPGVWRIPTTRWDLVNSFAFRDADGQVTLVDAGLTSAPPRILAALASIGSHAGDVTRIVLTHAHPDHAGGAAELARRTGVSPTVHAADAAAAREGRVAPRDPSSRLGRILGRLSDGHYPAVTVGSELADGEVLDVAGGLRVLHTPGHTPGHVSLLHEPGGVLVTGDAIWNVRGLRYSPAALCTDIALNDRTAAVLGDVEYGVAAFTHGPEVRERAREQVRRFVTDSSRRRR